MCIRDRGENVAFVAEYIERIVKNGEREALKAFLQAWSVA